MRLDVDDDELASCVACGLCLPHCPTFRVTGEESESPRGRIAAMRMTHSQPDTPATPELVTILDHCVQCRGCETACPSSVPFGRLMEGARYSLVMNASYQPRWKRLGYSALGHHRLLLAASSATALAQRVGVVPGRLGLGRLPLVRRPLQPKRRGVAEAWLFTGCVMDAWMRPVHAAALRVMEATGAVVAIPGRGAACCGALHLHAGLRQQAAKLARSVMEAMPGDAPVVADSAGCGAVMMSYGDWMADDEARRFSQRVVDVSHWLAPRMGDLPAGRRKLAGRVAVQDPCHLRHVQKAHLHVRTVLRDLVDLVELDDEGLCCGAGGAYSALHPELARGIRELKKQSIERSGADWVASANPGCMMHLRGAGLHVRHPVEMVDAALGLGDPAENDLAENDLAENEHAG